MEGMVLPAPPVAPPAPERNLEWADPTETEAQRREAPRTPAARARVGCPRVATEACPVEAEGPTLPEPVERSTRGALAVPSSARAELAGC